ncbi:Cellulose synthase-like B4, putative isoform 2, partial [Theobroma cacao]
QNPNTVNSKPKPLKFSAVPMAKPLSLPLYERVSCKGIMIRRTLDVTVFCLLLSLLAYRLRSLSNQGFTWLLAFLCESWFAFLWLLNLSTRWNPVEYKTYPENLLLRSLELPPIDMFVTTADPVLEPPLVTVNTVLSLLAVDYPAEKLACYVSDDGCSPLTFYSLVEASKFAKLWVPFCKKYSIQIRAPFQYFSAKSLPPVDGLSGFELEWKKMKDEYEHLCRKIEDAVHKLTLGPHSTEYAVFKNIERDNHPSIVKVIFENKEDHSSCLPHLVYVSREKRPNHPHHFKAGAMNVLTRVSGVMTNAPFMLNVDCDMFASNPKIILHAVCLLVGVDDEQECAFVQCPQIFYDALKDDPFGNRMTVPFTIFVGGMAGIQGPPYAGTGCFHRRKAIYGLPPNHDFDIKDCKILEERFGKSTEFSESVAEILFGSGEKHFPCDISSITGSACRVANCSYENNTCWGIEVGLTYGSVTEDVLTGLRIHTMGWKSVLLMPSPPAFMGCAPPGGPVSMTQMKRWGTGLLEVLFSKHSPILSAFSTKLHFRQALAYLQIVMWASRSIPQFCYNMLSAYCITTDSQFLPKVHEPFFYIPVSFSLISNLHSLSQYLQYGESIQAWWNHQRMERIHAVSSMLFACLGMFVKLLGFSETVFEITPKTQSVFNDENDVEKVGRFSFDESPIFIPITALLLVHLTALAIWLLGLQPLARGGDGSGLGEISCSVWVVLNFWPLVRGLFGKGKYGIP